MNAPATDTLPDSASLAVAGATPVMAQFFEMKARQPDAMLFFRMGDFYELFFEDAVKAAEVLGIARTTRGTHAGQPIPMAGVPVHAAEAYLARLIRAGHKVAVCEQMEDPAEARKRGSKSVVRRDIVRVVTAGTLTEDTLLDARGANRLVAVAVRSQSAGVVSVELSTGEVETVELHRSGLAAVLAGLRPSEILVPERLLSDDDLREALQVAGGHLQPLPGALGDLAGAQARAEALYGVMTLDGFGQFSPAEIVALGLISVHLEMTQGGKMPRLRPPRRRAEHDFMMIDPATRHGLEIDRTTSGNREGSLLGDIDRTLTAPGSRLLAERISRPLVSLPLINARLDLVGWLLEHRDLRARVRSHLAGAADLQRAVGRLSVGRGGPRDLAALRAGMALASVLSKELCDRGDALRSVPADLEQIRLSLSAAEQDPRLARLQGELVDALEPEVPQHATDGGFVRAGFIDELDEVRTLRDDSRKVVARLEVELAQETGLPLKIRHNGMLGYFLEIGAARAEVLREPPYRDRFVHRQTMANQVRFTTSELSDLDSRISRAADRSRALEIEAFEGWRQAAMDLGTALGEIGAALASLDVGAALAEWAEEARAVRPELCSDQSFEAEGARHIVVESALRRVGNAFTPNDCRLDGEAALGPRLAIVTGPNMAGKSTFLRQNAQLAILAQSGCYVPAGRLKLGIVDRLFSRVGSGDDLSRGRSTFMTEMVETAAILSQATSRSLVVLDEIGRGTATWDGLAIAWATAEALHQTNQCRTLFATHYHELAVLADRMEGVANLSLRAREWDGDLVFLHEVAAGAADRSYGVQVAKLAGVPGPVVARAHQILETLEGRAAKPLPFDDLPLFSHLAVPAQTAFGPDFAAAGPDPLRDALAIIEPDDLTPRQALDALYRLKGVAASEAIAPGGHLRP